jgi:hypothetical protein
VNSKRATRAMTSWNDGPLLTGPVRAYKDNKAHCIVIETTKDNAAGCGLQVCIVELDCVREARVIVAIPDLLRGLEPFAALGRRLAEADGDAPLITDTGVKLEITVGDMQRIAAACAKVFPPEEKAAGGRGMRRSPAKRFRPKTGI